MQGTYQRGEDGRSGAATDRQTGARLDERAGGRGVLVAEPDEVVPVVRCDESDGRPEPNPASLKGRSATGPPSAAEPTASTAMIRAAGSSLRKYRAMPARVPPVETATATAS